MSETVQFKMKIPADVKEWLMREAERNVRSQGAEVVFCLREAMARRGQNIEAA